MVSAPCIYICFLAVNTIWFYFFLNWGILGPPAAAGAHLPPDRVPRHLPVPVPVCAHPAPWVQDPGVVPEQVCQVTASQLEIFSTCSQTGALTPPLCSWNWSKMNWSPSCLLRWCELVATSQQGWRGQSEGSVHTGVLWVGPGGQWSRSKNVKHLPVHDRGHLS